MSNHINAVSTSKQVRKKFCQITNLVWQKNYVKSQWCLLFTSNKWDFTKFMWNQSNLCFYVKAIWFDRKFLSNHSTLSAHFKRNKICPKTKNCVKPMQCNDIQIDLAEYFCQITTVWKCWDFSVIQILCEINFVGFRSSKKMSFLPFFWALNFFIWVIFSLQKVQDFKEIKIQCL